MSVPRTLDGLLAPGPFVGRESPALRALWIAPLALIGEIAAIQLLPTSALRVGLPATHLLLIPFLLLNIRLIGVRLILAGLTLNLLVMVANGGLMPVEMSAVEAVGKHENQALVVGDHIAGTKNVLLAGEDIHLRALSDAVVLPVPRPFTRAISAGDLVIMAGIGAVAVGLVTGSAKKRMRRQEA